MPPQSRIARALALLVPPRCWCCRGPAPEGAPLCVDCAAAVIVLRDPRCPRCAQPAPCGVRCPAAGSAVLRCWAPVAHAGPARALVHALKFSGATPAAVAMAAQMALAPAAVLGRRPALVPVPSHAWRRRQTGVDHAGMLASALALRTALPVADCLRRDGAPVRQSGATRAARRAPDRLIVAVRTAPPPVALLVDDVHTTGATLDACARALRSAGCADVRAITYARTLR